MPVFVLLWGKQRFWKNWIYVKRSQRGEGTEEFNSTALKREWHSLSAMFYSQVILARKGPLGKIWLVAHFDKKLTKNQIFSTDISDSVQSVLNPAAPLALRVSGHLMLGIVRIYSRKVHTLHFSSKNNTNRDNILFFIGEVSHDWLYRGNVED